MIRLSWSLSLRRHIPYASSYYFLSYYRGVNESTQNFYLKLSIFCLLFPLYILFCLIVYSQGQHQEFKLEGQVNYHHGTEAGGPTYYFRRKRNIRSWIQYVFFFFFLSLMIVFQWLIVCAACVHFFVLTVRRSFWKFCALYVAVIGVLNIKLMRIYKNGFQRSYMGMCVLDM